MRIPYVIDNQTHRMVDILNGLLAQHQKRSLDLGCLCAFPTRCHAGPC